MGPLALPAVAHGRTGMGDAAARPVHGYLRPGRYPHHTGPGCRGREKRRIVGAAGASHESSDSEVAGESAMSSFESEISEAERWLASPRFEGITRLYSARQVVEQRGTIPTDYTVAR